MSSRWIVTRRGARSTSTPCARVLVQRAAVALQRRMHRRHLLDRADEALGTRRRSPRGRRRTGRRCMHVALGIAGRSWFAEAAAWRGSACRRRGSPVANLVAAPKHSGSSPDASGSRVPVWPAFSARNRRLAFCSASLLDRPTGLSSSSTPCTARRCDARRPAHSPSFARERVGLRDQRTQARRRARWCDRTGSAGSAPYGCAAA